MLKCYQCSVDSPELPAGTIPGIVDSVLNAMTFAKQEEVKAWEQEFTPCEHTLCLQQKPAKAFDEEHLKKCSSCDLRENLWLCLECGNLGCGRQQFGGSGGNSHGLAHTDSSGHAVAVKLGSITSEGSADVYCYSCNEERIDPELQNHLAHWGINIADREKTEKSLMEMQVEQNLKWDFAMTTEDGRELQPVFGEGLTGLKNLGNSCYLASILQCLFSLPEFQARYYLPDDKPPSTDKPAEDLETQLRKLGDGLLSGRYSYSDPAVVASPSTAEIVHQKGLAPAMFKHLMGRGHEEFSTMRQQDAFELLLHVFKLITLSRHIAPSSDPVQSFRFVLEQRLQCRSCKKVRYRTDEQDNISVTVPARRKSTSQGGSDASNFERVSLKECLDIFTAEENVELTCPSCASTAGFSKTTLFKTFPQNLVVNARRFELVNWVPTKLDIPVDIDGDELDMDQFLSPGIQADEELIEEEVGGATQARFLPNEEALSQLEAMGFPKIRCEKALHATGNQDAEAAMNWLFAHMEDPDIDDPMELTQTSGSNILANVDDASISSLVEMGISPEHARKALSETDGDVNRALDWAFSHPDLGGDSGDSAAPATETSVDLSGSTKLPAKFQLQSIVCHKGSSIHAGYALLFPYSNTYHDKYADNFRHYVAFIRKKLDAAGLSWILFNDEKVVQALDVEEMKQCAYIYFFRRQ